MSEEHRLKKEQVIFSDAVRKALERAYEQAQIEEKAILYNGGVDDLAVADFFDEIIIDHRVGEKIVSAIAAKFAIVNNEISIGLLLREAKTLYKAKAWIRKTEEQLMKRPINSSDINFISIRYAEIDYIKEIDHSLELIRILIQKSKKTKRVRNGYFLEYCAVCWRLVNKYKILNFSESAGYSAYYCLEHHPKKSDGRYHYARTALLAAIDKSDDELRYEAIRRKNENLITPLFLYKSTARFAKKPLRMVIDSFNIGSSWKDRASRIKQISKSYYPYASAAMNNISVEEIYSWKEWFYAVINSLDPSGMDASSWVDADIDWRGMPDDQAATSLEVGENVLLNIIHRYESVNNIKAISRPRGPKKGAVKKNDSLRLEITNLVTRQIAEHNKIFVAKIAKEVNVSRQRVYVILKELGFH